jgi:DNA gyrase subunit B
MKILLNFHGKRRREEKSTYGAKDITVLEGLEPVRKRPGMYIGTTDTAGLHHLIKEVVDNSIDEAMAGFAKHIVVEILADNRLSITDDGRGIPVEIHKQTKKSTLETVLTILHAGGKFGGEGYKVSGGLHGVGVSVVNALSTYLRAEVHLDGSIYEQEYKIGKPQGKVKKIGTTKRTGTTITFEPDPTIFTNKIQFDRKFITEFLRRQAFLTKGVRIDLIDYRETPAYHHVFYFDGGLL